MRRFFGFFRFPGAHGSERGAIGRPSGPTRDGSLRRNRRARSQLHAATIGEVRAELFHELVVEAENQQRGCPLPDEDAGVPDSPLQLERGGCHD